MKLKNLCIILAATVFVTGCNLEKKAAVPQTLSNVMVRSSSSPAAQFPSGDQYAFVQFASDGEQDPEVAKIAQRIQTSLSKELKKKGYRPGEYAAIDFFVVYTLGLQHEINVLVGKSEVQGNEWIRAVAVPNDYVSGALLVQIIDAKKMEPVWLGVFNADIVLESVTEQQKQERVNYAVHELLKQFPPK